FFFQAEDGIRGFHVTGVQTCALPICDDRRREVAAESRLCWKGFAAQRTREIKQPRLRLFQRQWRIHSARQSPLLPPVFSSRRISSITIPFSIALPMS